MPLILVVLLVILPGTLSSQCKFDEVNPGCKATCGNVTIDISSVLQYPVTIVSGDDNYTFACGGQVQCAKFGDTTAVCQNNEHLLGVSTTYLVTWEFESLEPVTKFSILYGGGECEKVTCRSANVSFTESQDAESTTFSLVNKDTETQQYYFEVSGVCVGQPGCGGGNATGPVGIVLIFLFIAVLISYFIIGALVMYFARGAREIEVIPNASFWKDFPSLIKDGMLFTISPCYKRSRKDYDSM